MPPRRGSSSTTGSGVPPMSRASASWATASRWPAPPGPDSPSMPPCSRRSTAPSRWPAPEWRQRAPATIAGSSPRRSRSARTWRRSWSCWPTTHRRPAGCWLPCLRSTSTPWRQASAPWAWRAGASAACWTASRASRWREGQHPGEGLPGRGVRLQALRVFRWPDPERWWGKRAGRAEALRFRQPRPRPDRSLQMPDTIAEKTDLLRRTPGVLRALLGHAPEAWVDTPDKDGGWRPRDVVGHLITGEQTNWIARARRILDDGPSRPFDPFDRFEMLERDRGTPLDDLIDRFQSMP